MDDDLYFVGDKRETTGKATGINTELLWRILVSG